MCDPADMHIYRQHQLDLVCYFIKPHEVGRDIRDLLRGRVVVEGYGRHIGGRRWCWSG